MRIRGLDKTDLEIKYKNDPVVLELIEKLPSGGYDGAALRDKIKAIKIDAMRVVGKLELGVITKDTAIVDLGLIMARHTG